MATKERSREVNPYSKEADLALTEEQKQRLQDQVLKEYDDTLFQRQLWSDQVKKEAQMWLSGRGPERKVKPWPNAPLADDMEILTRRGWINVRDVWIGDDVMSQDPSSGELAWKPVVDKQEAYFDYMVWIRGKSLDQLVSPSHKMIHLKDRRRVADDGSKRWAFVPAESLPTSGWIPLTSSPWDGWKPELLFGLDAGDVAEFVGWFISEGWSFKSGSIGIGQSQKANPEKCERISALLKRLGFGFSYKNGNQFIVKVGRVDKWNRKEPSGAIPSDLREVLYSLGTCEHKHVPPRMKDMSAPLLSRMLDAMIAGDGNVKMRPGRLDSLSYFTTSKRLSDDVQEIAQKVGLRATITVKFPGDGGIIRGRQIQPRRIGYVVNINRKRFVQCAKLSRDFVSYGRKAYCVTTQWHTIYVRRNGIASWTGNSNVDIPLVAVTCEGMHAAMVAGFNANPPYIRFKESPKLEVYIEWTIKKEAEAEQPLDAFDLNYVVHGTGVGMVEPVIERFGEEEEERLRVINIDNIEDFFIPKKVFGQEPIDTAPFVGVRTYPYVYQLLDYKRQGLFSNVTADDGIEEPLEPDKAKEQTAKEEYQKTQAVVGWSEKIGKRVALLKWFTKFCLRADRPDEAPIDVIAWVSVQPRRKIYRCTRNPFNLRPFFHSVQVRVPGEFWGIGVPRRMVQLQDQINTIYNLRNDAKQMAVQPPGFFVPGHGFKPSEVKTAPGVLIPVDSKGSVEWMRPYPVGDDLEREDRLVVEWAQKLSGISDLILGQGVGEVATATGVRSILQQGSMRLDVLMKRNGWGKKRMVKLMIRWNRILRGRKGVKLRVVGTDEILEFKDKDFSLKFTPEFEVNSLSGNRQVERETAKVIYEGLMQNPVFRSDPMLAFQAADFLLESFGYQRRERFVPNFLKQQSNANLATNAEEENALMWQGVPQEVDFFDDHDHTAHVAAMRAAPEQLKPLFDLHIQRHIMFEEMKRQGIQHPNLPPSPSLGMPAAAPMNGRAGGTVGPTPTEQAATSGVGQGPANLRALARAEPPPGLVQV